MPSQNQDRIKQEKGETIKRQRSKKSAVHNEVSIPDALREVETFLMTEMQKSDQERDSDQSILYLTFLLPKINTKTVKKRSKT